LACGEKSVEFAEFIVDYGGLKEKRREGEGNSGFPLLPAILENLIEAYRSFFVIG